VDLLTRVWWLLLPVGPSTARQGLGPSGEKRRAEERRGRISTAALASRLQPHGDDDQHGKSATTNPSKNPVGSHVLTVVPRPIKIWPIDDG
jgi:hypothetical protein